MSKLWERPLFWVVAVFALPLLIACSTVSTTSASCAFVVGNGREGRDTELHRVLYPGQQVTLSTYETAYYVPCNSRNYIINDGTVKNANGKPVGDRHTQIEAITETNTAIRISASAFWTLNQSRSAMEKFYTVCHKFTCWENKDIGGGVNFATEGWNGMLGENFSQTMDGTARIAAKTVKDDIWRSQDQTEYKKPADGMSASFAEVIQARLGFTEDLFCGSGNSTWRDPKQPGQGEFTCTPVRIVVDSVQLKPAQSDQSSQSLKIINDLRYSNAQALYGPEAGFWLGLQDSIDRCKGAATPCMFNIGGSGGGPALPVPVARSNPTPVPPTPTPTRS